MRGSLLNRSSFCDYRLRLIKPTIDIQETSYQTTEVLQNQVKVMGRQTSEMLLKRVCHQSSKLFQHKHTMFECERLFYMPAVPASAIKAC